MASDIGLFPVAEDQPAWLARRQMLLAQIVDEEGTQAHLGDLWKRAMGRFMTLPDRCG